MLVMPNLNKNEKPRPHAAIEGIRQVDRSQLLLQKGVASKNSRLLASYANAELESTLQQQAPVHYEYNTRHGLDNSAERNDKKSLGGSNLKSIAYQANARSMKQLDDKVSKKGGNRIRIRQSQLLQNVRASQNLPLSTR